MFYRAKLIKKAQFPWRTYWKPYFLCIQTMSFPIFIVKFALTNNIGGLYGGMQIERREIDKMQDLKLDVEYEPMYNSYIIRFYYNGR